MKLAGVAKKGQTLVRWRLADENPVALLGGY